MDAAGTTQIGVEASVNALSSLYRLRPRLARRLVERTNYSRAVLSMLRAVDLYCESNGVKDRSRVRLATSLEDGRVVQRISLR